VPNGSQNAPAFSFNSSPDSGMFSPGRGEIALVQNGTLFLHNKGGANTALGAGALDGVTSGNNNTALGELALSNNTSGARNTAVGAAALVGNTAGFNNTAVGNNALLGATTNDNNTAIGVSALVGLTTGDNNIAIGSGAGAGLATASNSIFIGNLGVNLDSNTIRIGVPGSHSKTFIAGINDTLISNPCQVLVNNHQLGTNCISSRRYKTDIQSMTGIGALLQKLRPVTYRYKKAMEDGSRPLQYGLIAEEVAEVLPGLAVFDKEGRPDGVQYHLLPSFLLAGYQEQQKVIAAQTERIDTQASEIATMKQTNADLEQRLRDLEARISRLASR
jgi:hypothetical protein